MAAAAGGFAGGVSDFFAGGVSDFFAGAGGISEVRLKGSPGGGMLAPGRGTAVGPALAAASLLPR